MRNLGGNLSCVRGQVRTLAYKTRRNALSAELSNVWGVDDAFEAEYAEDYQLLTNDSGSDIKTAWIDKYTHH